MLARGQLHHHTGRIGQARSDQRLQLPCQNAHDAPIARAEGRLVAAAHGADHVVAVLAAVADLRDGDELVAEAGRRQIAPIGVALGVGIVAERGDTRGDQQRRLLCGEGRAQWIRPVCSFQLVAHEGQLLLGRLPAGVDDVQGMGPAGIVHVDEFAVDDDRRRHQRAHAISQPVPPPVGIGCDL